MGNFSRNSFKLTNVLHALTTGDTVTDPRHYVACLVQQGVPVVDADLNETADIQRSELELTLRHAIGDGVPGRGDDFALGPLAVDNDFAILPGLMLVGGWQVVNPAPAAYSDMARFFDINHVFLGTDLTTPAADRTDVVYLDAWQDEVSAGGAGGDPRLIDTRIGISTSVRLERKWTIRVAENVSDFGTLVLNQPGHRYAFLGRFFRSTSARIQAHMIEDRRRLGLTLADSIKSAMFLHRGTEVVDPTRFSQMLAALRQVLQLWERSSLFPIVLGTLEAFVSYQNTLNRIYGLVTAMEVSSDTGALSNQDGLGLLGKLADAQSELIAMVKLFGTSVPAQMAVMDLYQVYIDGDAAQSIAGIRPSLAVDDLLGAVKGQEALTDFLGSGTTALPAGAVSATLDNVTPTAPIVAGAALTATYKIHSLLLTPATPEKFDLEVVVSDVRWATALSQSHVTLAQNATATVTLTITPLNTLVAGDACGIQVIARAHRRPSLASTQPAVQFEINQLPPGEAFLFYSGGMPLDGTGILKLPRAALDNAQFDVDMTLVNSTGGAQSHAFDVAYELVWPATLPAGVDKTKWIPAASLTLPDQLVTGATAPLTLSIIGQDLTAAGVVDPVSFTLQATATLTKVNGVVVAGGKSLTVSLPVTVAVT